MEHRGGALDGILVLDFSRLLPGPFCTAILADHGARVIEIESPRRQEAIPGLPMPTVHRNKEQLLLDLARPAGREVFARLARRADVIVEGFRPGTAARLGIDYETARAASPSVVYCSLSGYGQTAGAMRDEAGHDINYTCVAGAMELFGVTAAEPCMPALQTADVAGGLNAAVGILAALLHRARTGEGQRVDVAIADSMLSLLAIPFSLARMGLPLRRGASLLAGGLACYGVYEASDGRLLAVGALEPRFFGSLCELLGVPGAASLQYALDGQEELRAILRGAFRAKTRDEWLALARGKDVCLTPVVGLEEALSGEQAAARGMVTAPPGGGESLLGPPVKMSLTPASVRTGPPKPGEHTDAILAELGYGREEIDALRRDGSVA